MTELNEQAKGATYTSARVAFFTWQNNGFSGTVNKEAAEEIGSVYGVETQKAFGGASGSFTITMKKPEAKSDFDYHSLWKDPEDVWVRIQFLVDDQIYDTMLGLVDTLTDTTMRAGLGARDQTYQIHGRDFGKVFETTKTYINPFITTHVGDFSVLHDVLKQIAVTSGTPDQFVSKLIEAWIGNDDRIAQPWFLPPAMTQGGPNKETFYRLLDLRNIQKMDTGSGEINAPQLVAIDQLDGRSLWDTLQQYCNGLLNELWVDLAPWANNPKALDNLRPAVFLRERPFKTRNDVTSWESLPTYDLFPRHIRSRQIAKGGGQVRYNYWLVTPSGYQGQAFAELIGRGFETDAKPGLPGSMPIINQQSIRRHGLRMFTEQSNYFPSKDAETIVIQQLAADWTRKLHDWHSPGHLQLTGTIQCTRMFPQIRIGQRIIERRSDRDIVFYVEGVSHSFQYPGAGATTLTLTHGEFVADNLLKFMYEEIEQSTEPLDAAGEKFATEEAFKAMITDLSNAERTSSKKASEGAKIETAKVATSNQDAIDNNLPLPEEEGGG